MALRPSEVEVLDELIRKRSAQAGEDERNLRYFEGNQRLRSIGHAIPESLRLFELFVGWPEVTVEAIVERSDLKALMRPGEVNADAELMDLADYNNLDAEWVLHHRDKLIFGRAIWSVGANPEDGDYPLIRSESPQEMTLAVDPYTRQLRAGMRLYSDDAVAHALGIDSATPFATLYLPDRTIWLHRDDAGKWHEMDRDEHELGRVPLVLTLNRRRTGPLVGRSEMAKVNGIADACARALTNMAIAAETLAVPQRYALGLTKGDFVGSDGRTLPTWEAYFGAIWATQNTEAKVGQFAGADLTNFHETVKLYGQIAASVTGYPAKYFGNFTTNPPAEGAIKAEEARLVKTVERSNREVGVSLGWAVELAARFRDGDWPERNRVKVETHDPATPTVAQRADAIAKLNGGVPILSREGSWDELGWSEARKARERQYFADEDRYQPLMVDLVPDALDTGA